MKILTTIDNIRNYRQLGKQLNEDNFKGRVREIQENELTELLGDALSYEFFDFLDNGFTNQAGTYNYDSERQFTAVSQDLSAWDGYSVRINGIAFGVVKTAVFGGVDTIITMTDESEALTSEALPSAISSIDYSTETKYTHLLNGQVYSKSGNDVRYNGLRPFLAWKFLAVFSMDGNIKHSDTGNFSIKSMNFEAPSSNDIKAAKSTYLQNSVREENRIIDYLNEKTTSFPLWRPKRNENIENFNFIVI